MLSIDGTRFGAERMARKASASTDRVAPNITPQRGIELIQRQLQQVQTVIRLSKGAPEVSKWTSTTEQILKATFGAPHEMLESFRNADGPLFFTSDTPDSYFEERYRDAMARRKALLEASIDLLR